MHTVSGTTISVIATTTRKYRPNTASPGFAKDVLARLVLPRSMDNVGQCGLQQRLQSKHPVTVCCGHIPTPIQNPTRVSSDECRPTRISAVVLHAFLLATPTRNEVLHGT